ncbi:hypothetical protein BJ508DRAFT_376150 [Ascobolus immersus RN42]|uniref:V-type proton ATPase subunit C n=1 Tax=Ascobolus immersus RN42 TaxID=1160509 RepID=A0A3N4I6R2_ASCIM|nr:hypothetical protein BJ508DRAFT_376150 [Ascobolus immersus RN42]
MSSPVSSVYSVFLSVLRSEAELDDGAKALLKVASKCSSVEAKELRTGSLENVLAVAEDLASLELRSLSFLKKLREMGNQIEEWDDSVPSLRQKMHEEQFEFEDLLSSRSLGFSPNSPFEALSTIAKVFSKNLDVSEKRILSKWNPYIELRARKSANDDSTAQLVQKSIQILIAKDAFVKDSEYLQTALVSVPNDALSDWFSCYEALAPNIVPRASDVIASDSKETLVTMTFFKRNTAEVTTALSETKFKVKELDCAEITSRDGSRSGADKLNFEERAARKEFIALITATSRQSTHEQMLVSCLRIYVESILRFGLPQEFAFYSLIMDGDAGEKALHDYIASQKSRNSENDMFTYEESNDDLIRSFTLMSRSTILSAFALA